MIQDYALPPNLRTVIGSDRLEFAVKAQRAQPLKMSLAVLIFGIVWLLFSSVFVFIFIGPLFMGQEVHFTVNDEPAMAGPGNLGPIIAPALILSIFVFVGISLISWGIYLLVKRGGYFVGTATRLISCQGGNIRSIDWEQFSGDIEISGDDREGNISLQMRSGKMVSQKNGPDRYVPDIVYISGIPDVFAVEHICRDRIKENDPTPIVPVSDDKSTPVIHESGDLNVF